MKYINFRCSLCHSFITPDKVYNFQNKQNKMTHIIVECDICKKDTKAIFTKSENQGSLKIMKDQPKSRGT